MNLWNKIRAEFISFQRSEKLFCLFIMLVAFFIAAEYGITRPASNALCITLFSSKIFPWLWLATVPLNLSIVAFYNRFLPSVGPLKMMGILAAATIAVNTSAAFLIQDFPGYALFQFIWKDIYVLFMFKQLWSLIHTTIAASRAKYLYGIIYAMGTVGSIAGGMLPSFFAVKLGSEQLFLFTFPAYLFLFFFYWKAFKHSAVQEKGFLQNAPEEKAQGFGTVFRSPLLFSVLALVVMMQASVALMEYQFNIHLEMNIADLDLRTEYVGRMLSLTNLLSGTLQFVGSFLLVHTLGIRGSHLAIPLALLANAVGMVFIPSFALVSFSVLIIKAIDFSLFGVIREMLYIPMKVDEKFRAKAVIDVFAYRTSKALVSLCVLGLQLFAGLELLRWVSYITVGILLLWLGVVWFLLRRHYMAPATQPSV
jgi:ATP/ADP translocase